MSPPAPLTATLRSMLAADPAEHAPGREWLRGLALAALITVSYTALGLVGFFHWMVANGVLFSALWLLPSRWWPWIFAGTIAARSLIGIIAHTTSGVSGPFLGYWSGPLQYVLGNVLEPFLVGLGVLLLRHWRTAPDTPANIQQITRLHLGAIVSALAVMGKDLLYVWNDGWVGDVRLAQIVDVVPITAQGALPLLGVFAIKNFLGTFVGILLVAPLVAWLAAPENRVGSTVILRAAMRYLLPVLAVYLWWVSFTPATELAELLRRLLLVAVVAFAMRFGWRGACLALLLVSVTTAVEEHLGMAYASPIWMQLFIALVGAMALLFGATIDGARWQTEQLRLAKGETERLAAELNAVATRNLQTEERERRNLAGELHDEFGQNLTALQTRLMLLAPRFNEVGQAGAVESLLELTRSMRQNISGVLESLRPAALEQLGLYRAIEHGLVRRLAEDAGVSLETELQGDARLLPLIEDVHRIAAYRLVQEGVTNVVRHARASSCQVRLRVTQRDGQLWLFVDVRDDGIGAAARLRAGRGLSHMRDRVLALGGRLHIGGRPRGLRLHALFRHPLGD